MAIEGTPPNLDDIRLQIKNLEQQRTMLSHLEQQFRSELVDRLNDIANERQTIDQDIRQWKRILHARESMHESRN